MPYNDDGRDHWCLNTIPADFGWGTIWRFTELGASTFSIIHNLNLCIAALRKAVIDLKQFENAGFVCDRDYFGIKQSKVIPPEALLNILGIILAIG